MAFAYKKKKNPDPVRQANIEKAEDNVYRTKEITRLRGEVSQGSSLWENVGKLDGRTSPKLGSCAVDVVNGDTFEVAQSMMRAFDSTKSVIGASKNGVPSYPYLESGEPLVVVLNMANAFRAGGGYLNGATAQEEDLCRRSTLYAALETFRYPIPSQSMLYTKNVMIIRDASNTLLPSGRLYKDLPIVSVISAATVEKPDLITVNGRETYKNQADATTQIMTCRAILRVAARNKHRRLVLGALGCGAFRHPQQTAVDLWIEVLSSAEFYGWFENVTFAVLSHGTPIPGGPSYNYTAFRDGLQGLLVGEKGAKADTTRRTRMSRVMTSDDVDEDADEEGLLRPRSRAASRARSRSRAAESVEPEEVPLPVSRTRSSTRLREQSRTRAGSHARVYPRRASSNSGRKRVRDVREERGVFYRLLVPILVIIFAYFMFQFAGFCWFMVQKVVYEQMRSWEEFFGDEEKIVYQRVE